MTFQEENEWRDNLNQELFEDRVFCDYFEECNPNPDGGGVITPMNEDETMTWARGVFDRLKSTDDFI